ncbi:MAG: hypothetical protein JNL59_01105 [Chitinophagaceae bacterium]|jgi:amino acid transporter|nr:hypothetical protein [Chitinophagaceae bacterium]
MGAVINGFSFWGNFRVASTVNFVVSCIFMGVFKQLAEYLFIRKKDPDRPDSKWVGYMHGINRISLILFIICLIILAIKLLR